MIEEAVEFIGVRTLRGGQEEYQHGKSFFFSGLTALCFGIGNFLIADVSHLGYKAIYP